MQDNAAFNDVSMGPVEYGLIGVIVIILTILAGAMSSGESIGRKDAKVLDDFEEPPSPRRLSNASSKASDRPPMTIVTYTPRKSRSSFR